MKSCDININLKYEQTCTLNPMIICSPASSRNLLLFVDSNVVSIMFMSEITVATTSCKNSKTVPLHLPAIFNNKKRFWGHQLVGACHINP